MNFDYVIVGGGSAGSTVNSQALDCPARGAHSNSASKTSTPDHNMTAPTT